MNWRDRIKALKGGATVFLRTTRNLLWDISSKELGIKEAIVDISKAYDDLAIRTGDDYAFDERTVTAYAESILELYALHHLIHILGMSVFHEQIMDLEIKRKFGPSYQQPPQRLDRRDLITLAKLIKQNEEVTYGRERSETTKDRDQSRKQDPESES